MVPFLRSAHFIVCVTVNSVLVVVTYYHYCIYINVVFIQVNGTLTLSIMQYAHNHQPTRCVNHYHTHVSSKQLYWHLFCSESVFVQCLGIRFLLTLMLLLWNPVDMHEHVCWGTCLLNACSSVTISRYWRSILHEW